MRLCLKSRSYLALVVAFLVAAAGRAAEPGDWDDPNWQLLREAHIARDNASLIAYLRDQCGDDADLGRLDTLIRLLGAADFDAREQASKALPSLGPAALAKLRAAMNGPDAEVSRRAGECVARIEKKWRPELALAAVRVLVRRGCVDAIPALVRFLPFADFEGLDDALWFGLDSLVVRQGKIDPCLTDALRDPVPVRRAAAACIVARRGDADQRAAVRKLLTDADAEVRLRSAQGLLAAGDKAGVPTLVALLEGTPEETAWQAEELLRYVAGAEAPPAVVGAGAAEDRAACRKAWEAWWKEHEAGVDLAALDKTSRRPGLILLCDGGLAEEATGRVWLLGCDGVTRWELRKLSYPSDARLIDGPRVVVAERNLTPAKPTAESGVSARDLDGKVLWRYQGVDDPMLCRQLDDGRILVAGPKLVIAEVDAAKTEVVLKDFAARDYTAEEYPSYLPADRRVITCRPKEDSNTREWREVSPVEAGRQLKYPSWPSCFDYVLSSKGLQEADYDPRHDHVEVEAWATRVVQWGDPNPRSYNPWVWKVRMPGVFQAAKLPNGNVLAGGVGRVVEIDREGRVVWSDSFEDQAQQAHACLNRVRLGFDGPRAELDLTANQSAWLQGLGSKDAAVRRRTAAAIGEMGRWGQEAGPSLIPLLRDPDETVRDAARGALARIYPVFPPQVRTALRDKDPGVRQNAMNTNNLVPRPLEDVESDARNGLLKDEWFNVFMDQLKDSDPDIRWCGANMLGGDEFHAREVIPALIEATRDPVAKVRAVAAKSLEHFGADAKAAIPALVACLKDEDMQVREWSAHALSEIDPSDDRAFPALLEAVQDKEGNYYAAFALSRCKSRAKEVVPILLKQLHRKDALSSADTGVIRLLGEFGPDAKCAVPALSAIVSDKSVEPRYRAAAAYALGELGSAAKEALPDIKKLHAEHGHDSFAEELQRIEDEIEDD